MGVEPIILNNNYDQMPHINRLGAKRMRGFRPTTLVSSKYRALNTMAADPDKNSYRKTQCTYKRDSDARSRSSCCRGKEMSITHSDCVFVALVIQNAKRLRRIILSSSVAFFACTIFFHII